MPDEPDKPIPEVVVEPRTPEGEEIEVIADPVVTPVTQVSPEEDPVLAEVKKTRKSVARMQKELRRLKKDAKVEGEVVVVPEAQVRKPKTDADPFRRFFVALGGRRRRPPDG
jgi:hypothetical protein